MEPLPAAAIAGLTPGDVEIRFYDDRMEKIPYKHILYIQRDGKNARIISENGESKVRKSLKKIYEELDTQEFIFIDRGFIG